MQRSADSEDCTVSQIYSKPIGAIPGSNCRTEVHHDSIKQQTASRIEVAKKADRQTDRHLDRRSKGRDMAMSVPFVIV
jgi:hypothetical protein